MADNNRTDGPARGDVQSQGQQQTSSVVANARNVTTNTGIGGVGPLPQSGNQKPQITLEGLGNIHEVNPDIDVPAEDEDEGTGEWAVVLSDYLSGNGGVGFMKGDVRRVSKLIPLYGDNRFLSGARANAKRLFENNAIRLATEDEAFRASVPDETTGKPIGRVSVDIMNDAGQAAISRQVQLEAENELLRTQLAQLNVAKDKSSPVPNPNAKTGTGTTTNDF